MDAQLPPALASALASALVEAGHQAEHLEDGHAHPSELSPRLDGSWRKT